MTPKKLALILIAAGLAIAATSAAFDLPPYSWLRSGALSPSGDNTVAMAFRERV